MKNLRLALWLASIWACVFAAACDQTRPIVDTVPEEGGGGGSASSSGAGGQGGLGGAGGSGG